MGIAKDFTLTPVHAHLNLLGWVSMLLYGFFYRGTLGRVGRLASGQVIAAALGFPAMTGGLALLLSGHEAIALAEPLVMVGSPNYAFAIYNSALVGTILGEGEKNEKKIARAISLSPIDPMNHSMLATRALTHPIRGNRDAAAE